MKFWSIMLAVVLVMMMLAAGGCGVIAKKAVEGATGISVDEEGGSVTIKGKDGSELNMNSEEGKLAEGFPSEVPIYDGKITDSTSFSAEGKSTFMATVVTDDSFDDVKSFYKDKLASGGWKILYEDDSLSGADRAGSFAAELNTWSVTIGMTTNSDGQIEITTVVGTKTE